MTAPRTNEKGEIVEWQLQSVDGKALTSLFDSGLITTETAKQVKVAYERFHKYATHTLGSAINNERKRLAKDVLARAGSHGELSSESCF